MRIKVLRFRRTRKDGPLEVIFKENSVYSFAILPKEATLLVGDTAFVFNSSEEPKMVLTFRGEFISLVAPGELIKFTLLSRTQERESWKVEKS